MPATLKSKWGGVIMAASTHVGDNHIIPIAIGLHDIENELNWRHLSPETSGSHSRDQASQKLSLFMTGRKASNKLRDKFSHFSFESICVWHLEKNVNTIFKSKFGGQIWAAAKAGSQVKHDEAMATISAINCDAAEYLKNSDPKSRKQEYANADNILSPRSFRTFNQNRDNGRRHQMFQTGDHLFKVTSLTSGYTPYYSQQIVSVDLDTINCDETLQPPNVVRKTGRPQKVCLRSRGEVDDNDRYACKRMWDCLDTMFEHAVVGNPPQCCLLTFEEGNPRTIPAAAGYWKFQMEVQGQRELVFAMLCVLTVVVIITARHLAESPSID
ncbi:hypothetical protein BASA60_001566 [Batrachochytrium salamandrivorans]|nr:hypothetical protein BASA60_001566 [Batrachochytrium salamandrivorans]